MILLLSIALLQSPADCRADSPAVTAVRAVADGIIAADNARGSEPRVLDDAYMMTLRLEPDGRWRISHLMWHPQK